MKTHVPLIADSKPRRRWFQFTLQRLFALITLSAIAVGWFVSRFEHARRTVVAIEAAGGAVLYESNLEDFAQEETLLTRIKRLFPKAYYAAVDHVQLESYSEKEAIVPLLPELHALETVQLRDCEITAADMELFNRCENLKSLSFSRVKLTEEACRILATNRSVTDLWFRETEISVASLATILNSLKIEKISLNGSTITDEYAECLLAAPTLTHVTVSETMFTDEGVAILCRLPALNYLDLDDSQITDDCIPHVLRAESMTGISIQETALTDSALDRLAEHKSLAFIHVAIGDFSDEATARFKRNSKTVLLSPMFCGT